MLGQKQFRVVLIGWLQLVFLFNIPAQNLEIWEIQGNGNSSPYLGQSINSANNVVTGVGDSYFFIQTPVERSDNDPLTSDGLFIYTGSFPNVQVGDLVNVTGIVREFEGLTELSGFGLEFESTGATSGLPDPVQLTNTFPSSSAQVVRDLERVENMMVSYTAQVIQGSTTDEIAALSARTERPMREAGIEFPGENGLPLWDGNPEIFWIDPNALNAPNNRFLSVGMTVTASGPLFQSYDLYVHFPSTYDISGTAFERNVRARNAQEVTVGCLNVKLLFTDNSDYQTKLSKLSRYIVQRLGAPDILALQEVGNLTALQELAFYVDQLDNDINYAPYLLVGNGSLQTAYLVRPRIQNVEVTQLDPNVNLSIGGRLHDRPPLLLEATLPTEPPTPINVLNLHVRSLLGIEGSNEDFVRTKRYEQSLSIAQMVQDRQDDNLIVLGDFNAYQYSDGYVDVLNQIAGGSSLGAEYSVQDIVDPPLIQQVLTLPEEEHYSFVFRGSATLLDHCLTTQLTDLEVVDFAMARGNADLSVAFEDNATLLGRSSDHDGFVIFLEPDAPVAVEDVAPDKQGLAVSFNNPIRLGQDEIVVQQSQGPFAVRLWGTDGRLVWQNQSIGSRILLPRSLPRGLFFLEVQGRNARALKKVILMD